MWEKKQISHAEAFQIIYVDTHLSRRWNITPTHGVLVAQSDFLLKSAMCKREGKKKQLYINNRET